MPFTPDTQPPLPFSGSNRISRHCSYLAARDAATSRGWKTQQYLDYLRRVGRATDWQAADYFHWPLSSICSIRNGCVDRGEVTVGGCARGKHGKLVTLWTLNRHATEQAAT